MKYLRWTFWLVLIAMITGFLHYTLPQHDVVRIVGADSRRVEVAANSLFWSRAEVNLAGTSSRDVFFIYAVDAKGRSHEYRNEDTGWGWPPYFKVDSFGLQARAKDMVSSEAAPIWVSISHYGWREKAFLGIFPNAVGVTRVGGPDVTIVPWVPIIVLILLLVALIMLRRMWLQFRERMVDPALVRVERAMDGVEAQAGAARHGARSFWGRVRGWFGGGKKG